MGLLDNAKELLNQHDDKVDEALDTAGELAKGRFDGHEGKIDGLIDQAQQGTGDGDSTATPPEAAPDHPAEGGEPAPDAPGGPGHAPPQQ